MIVGTWAMKTALKIDDGTLLKEDDEVLVHYHHNEHHNKQVPVKGRILRLRQGERNQLGDHIILDASMEYHSDIRMIYVYQIDAIKHLE